MCWVGRGSVCRGNKGFMNTAYFDTCALSWIKSKLSSLSNCNQRYNNPANRQKFAVKALWWEFYFQLSMYSTLTKNFMFDLLFHMIQTSLVGHVELYIYSTWVGWIWELFSPPKLFSANCLCDSFYMYLHMLSSFILNNKFTFKYNLLKYIQGQYLWKGGPIYSLFRKNFAVSLCCWQKNQKTIFSNTFLSPIVWFQGNISVFFNIKS